MRLLPSALVLSVWVAALIETPTVQAHWSAPGSLGHGGGHEAGGFHQAGNFAPVPKGRLHGPHGPINWPKGKEFGSGLRNAAGPGGLPEPQGQLASEADRKLRLRRGDDKPYS
ncbi:hypothetical protein ON010_g14886 [Phytophthora cinnamomi]|nr:hypothetical protein ON010_g14886 [Phytophthora cinnamomi]